MCVCMYMYIYVDGNIPMKCKVRAIHGTVEEFVTFTSQSNFSELSKHV